MFAADRCRFSVERRSVLQALAALPLLSLSPLLAAQPLQLITRLWPSREYTRLVIETPQQLHFRYMILHNPERLVFDFPYSKTLEELAAMSLLVESSDPYVAAIRTGNRGREFRLVVDVKSEVEPQVFVLPPVEGFFGYRLVADIYPKVLFDPLLMLVREFEAQDNVAALAEKYADDEELLALVREYETKIENQAGKTPTVPVPEAKVQAETPDKTPDQSPDKPPEKTPAKPAPAIVKSTRPVIVMIDPGHGGEDPGAIGKRGTQEKHVVLAIARQMKKLIDAIPNMRAMLTRDDDYFVPLRQRVEKARRVKADLFVSVHADAFSRRAARGSSVFALSAKGATSEAARWLAKKENDADLVGGVNIKANKDNVLARTLLDLSQSAQIRSSINVGELVLKELALHNALHKGVVEQAGFAVLKAPDIPSILVETAFISNPEEEQKLRSARHQQRFAQSIVQGIVQFFKA